MLSNIFKIIFVAMLAMSTSSCNAADVSKETAKPVMPASVPSASVATNIQVKNTSYDFTDSSSWNLTVSAWEKMAAKDYVGTIAYAKKCLELYEAQAIEMARSMARFTPPGREDDYEVVNDVATAHYIMGEAYMKEAKYDAAVREFDLIIARYPFAQCWDPRGWFWKVAEVSRKNLDKIEKLKTGK